MAKIGSGEILIRWDDGAEAVLGEVTLSAKIVEAEMKVEIPLWKVGRGMAWLGIQLMWEWVKRRVRGDGD